MVEWISYFLENPPITDMQEKTSSNVPFPLPMKVVIAVGMFVLLLGRLTNSNADPDLWGYLAFGRYYWEFGFPYQDVFSYLPTKELWIYHEWLTGVLFYPLFEASGGTGLQIFKFGVGLLTAAIIYLAALKRGAPAAAAVIGLFLVSPLFGFAYSPVRAQVFTNLFFILTILIIEEARVDGKFLRLLWLVPIQILWCNLHGGFLAGLGLILLYAFGEMLSRRNPLPYIGIFLACCTATLINPYGLDYWRYMHEAVSMARPEIMEWASLYQMLQGGIYYDNVVAFLVLLCLAVLFVGKWGRKEYPVIIVLTVTAYLGFSHVRHEAFFLLAFGAYLPRYFAEAWKELETFPDTFRRWRAIAIKATPFFFVGLTLLFLPPLLTGSPLRLNVPSDKSAIKSGDNYPAGAIAFMKREGITGNILTEFDWGELMLWDFYPESRIAMDGRYETVYTREVCDEFFTTFKGERDWERFLEEYPHEIIVIRSNSYLYSLLKKRTDWLESYKDESAVVLQKKERTLPKEG